MLSREKAGEDEDLGRSREGHAERKVVIGRVIERIKGGLAVDIGVRAFLPGSQIDVRPVRTPIDARPGAADARDQGQEARQHRPRAVPSKRRTPRRRSTRSTRWPRARSSAAWSRTSPTTARSSTWAASTACSTSRTCRGAAHAPSELFNVNQEIDVIVLEDDLATELAHSATSS